MTEVKEKKFRKFTRAQRKHICGVIREFLRTHPSSGRIEIAEHLNEQGIKPNNDDKWTGVSMGNFLARNPIRVRQTTAPEPRATRGGSDKISVAEIVLASSLSQQEKEVVLKSLFSTN